MSIDSCEFDYVIIGSGFGGSVSAHRLTEKGYSVAVLEQGKRFETKDMAKSTWDLRKYLWMPKLGMYGIMGITTLKDVVVFHGAGVGGGSLVYANTHLEPLDAFYTDPKWADLLDWKTELAPFYNEAKRMLGSVTSPLLTKTDKALKAVLEEDGQGDTFKKHTVGVFFGEPGKKAADPYFEGEGPERVGCTKCGACMVGCRVGAKNTLDKNYLYFAEKRGARVFPETRAVDIIPLGAKDGSDGYKIVTERSTGVTKKEKSFTAQNVILSAGVLGTVKLLTECKERGSLSNLSPTLGTFVRTNSESIQGIVVDGGEDVSKGIAITSGGFTKEGTHVELFRYGSAADAMSLMSTVHVGGGSMPRQVYFLAAILRHPWQFLRRIVWPFGWSKSMAGVLAMRATDTSMNLVRKRPWYFPFKKTLTSDWGDREPPPTYMKDVHQLTKKLADKLGGTAGSVTPEVLLDTTTTAHILGGCPMGADTADGVLDKDNKAFGYTGLMVVDGSMISANLGVNPSLTITAMAERAMSKIPNKESA